MNRPGKMGHLKEVRQAIMSTKQISWNEKDAHTRCASRRQAELFHQLQDPSSQANAKRHDKLELVMSGEVDRGWSSGRNMTTQKRASQYIHKDTSPHHNASPHYSGQYYWYVM